MRKKPGWIKKIFFNVEDYHESMTSPERYRRFRRTLSLVMIAAFLIPLILTTMLSYYAYRSNMLAYLRWNAESATKTIETFLTELQAVLLYTAEGHTYEELLNQKNLNELYHRLKTHYPGVVDLGIIDHKGIQRAYAGPYELAGKDYSNRECCKTSSAGKTVIGKIELGYRNVPHFCISANVFSPVEGKSWTFRTSIDATTLDNYIDKITMREINFDHNKKICDDFSVYGVPTLLIINNNKI